MTHDATGTADAGVHHVGIAALTRRPRGATHWSVRELGDETGISKSTVQRYLALFGVQPHRSKSFKLSTDPLFIEKLRNVVGLYLNAPDIAFTRAVVI